MRKRIYNIWRWYQQLPVSIKASIWYMICAVILKGVSTLSAPLFARLIPAEEYGKLMMIMAWQQIFILFATWEISSGTYQKGIFKFRDSLDEYTSATIELMHFLTLIFFCGLWSVQNLFGDFLRIDCYVIVSLMIYLWIYPSYQCWFVRQRTMNLYKNVVFASILFGALSVIVPIIAIFVFEPTAKVKYISTLFGGMLVSLYFYIPYSNPLRFSEWKTLIRKYWMYSIRLAGPLLLHVLSYMILNQMDRIMIGIMVGDREVAYYSVAYMIGLSLNILESSITHSFTPWLYKQMNLMNYDNIESKLNVIICFLSGCIVLFTLCTPELIYFFPQDYYEAIYCIPPIVASVLFMFLYSVFVNMETYFETTIYVMYASMVAAGVNMVLNYIFIPLLGYIVCAYTTLFSYIFVAIGHSLLLKRIYFKKMGKLLEFPIEKIMILGVVAFIESLVSVAIYNYVYIRYGIVMVVICLSYCFRSVWFNWILEIKGNGEIK